MARRTLIPLLALLTASAAAQDVALPPEVYQRPGPHVVVNGVLLNAPVREVGGSLFLPMRAVFEALNAEVKWYPAAQQIIATRGTTTVQLWINRPVAIVNDKEIRLAAPPSLMAGTTYVPLRFPAEAFGGEVKWMGSLRTAAITIAPLGGQPAPNEPQPQPAARPALEGVVMTKVTSGVTALVVQNLKGETALVELAPQCSITRANMGETLKPSTFAAIELGDKVRITRDPAGKATAVEARYAQVTGVAAAIANNRLLLEDGSLYQLQPDIRVVNTRGETAPLAQVVKGIRVTLDLTPETTNVWRVTIPVSAAQAEPKPATDSPVILTVAAVGYTKPLKAGDRLTLQVTGAPDAESVTVSVGDVLRDIRLTQTAPGTYTRQITIAPNTNVTAAPIVATMRLNGKQSEPVRGTAPITIDTRAPSFDALIPGDGTRLMDRNPAIEAAYSDPGGSGVDTGAVRVVVNGKDVTLQATVTETRARFRAENLPIGPVSVKITIADHAGNTATAEWGAVVEQATAAGERYVRHDAAKPLTVGQKLNLVARFPAPPTRLEWFMGNKLIGTAMTRDAATGEYRTSYTIAESDAVGEHSVSVRAYTSGNESQVLFAADPVTVIARARTFKITSPDDKSRAPAMLVVTGEATPDSQIRVTVEYESRVAFLPVKGQIYRGVVTADAKGVWQTEPIETGGLLIRPDTYKVIAERLGADGDVVETITIGLTRR
ncbi:MAG: copper amine oxidase N-terminal domain-containing protein [Chthonomonadales bacterium]|nr:copper amine oxidase N-terminal domain-containing protein [Chthonomonadales bacterium]